MKRSIRSLCVLSFLLALPTVASAHITRRPPPPPSNDVPPVSQRVPELDPGAATAGLALLAGGVLLLTEQRRRRRSA